MGNISSPLREDLPQLRCNEDLLLPLIFPALVTSSIYPCLYSAHHNACVSGNRQSPVLVHQTSLLLPTGIVSPWSHLLKGYSVRSRVEAMVLHTVGPTPLVECMHAIEGYDDVINTKLAEMECYETTVPGTRLKPFRMVCLLGNIWSRSSDSSLSSRNSSFSSKKDGSIISNSYFH
jgi:hypothetical protein